MFQNINFLKIWTSEIYIVKFGSNGSNGQKFRCRVRND